MWLKSASENKDGEMLTGMPNDSVITDHKGA